MKITQISILGTGGVQGQVKGQQLMGIKAAQLKFSVEQNNTNRHRVSILKIQTLRHYRSNTVEVL